MNRKIKLIKFFEKGYTIDINGNVFNPKGKKLRLYTHTLKNGYSRKEVAIRHKDVKFQLLVHRLQAYLKFGEIIFEEAVQVRHLDGNSLNNSWDNIEIGTCSENRLDMSDEIRKEISFKAIRQKQNNSRPYEQRCLIYEDLKNGVPYSEIMKKHNVSSKGTLSFMKNKSEEYREYLGL